MLTLLFSEVDVVIVIYIHINDALYTLWVQL